MGLPVWVVVEVVWGWTEGLAVAAKRASVCICICFSMEVSVEVAGGGSSMLAPVFGWLNAHSGCSVFSVASKSDCC